MTYFSSARDAEIIADGGFFCQVCAVAKPINEQSPDPRHCQDCSDILAMDKVTVSTPDTWLKDSMIFAHYGRQYVLTPGLSTIFLNDAPDIDTDGDQTTQGKENTRHKIEKGDIHGHQVTQMSAIMGRKPLDLPTEKVLELSGAGRSIRDIADELQINRETVRRIIAGQRVMVGI